MLADGGIELDSARNVALQLNDTPVPGATSLLSLYQANCIALKAARWISWARADDAVAVLDLP